MSNQFSMKRSTKPLKGQTITSNYGSFDTLTANNLQLESISIAGILEDGILQNVVIKDSQIINTVIGAESPNVGYFSDLRAYQNVNFISNMFGSTVSWDPTTAIFNIKNSTLKVEGCSFLGNLEICENYISATNVNGDVNIIPNGIGTIYLQGPVYNTISQGNFYSEVNSGGITFTSQDDIIYVSSSGSFNTTTFHSQNFKTVNGDISLTTENPVTLQISSINTTFGSTKITTTLNNNLKVGDVINLSNTNVIDNSYTVGSILSDNTFLLSTTTPSISNVTRGNLLKTLTNNILLNTQSLVKIPENTDLTFGTTKNSISGNTQSLLITSYGDTTLQIPTSSSFIIPQNTFVQFGIPSTTGSTGLITSGNYINYNGSMNFVGTNTLKFSSPLTQINSTDTRFYDPILTIGDYSSITNDSKDRGVEFRYFNNSTGSMQLGWFGYKTSTNKFTFIPNATNTNEIITGNVGEFDIGDITAKNITLSTGGSFDINCGSIVNVKYITGCSGTINVIAASNLNITSGNRIALVASSDIYIPNNIPITIGTNGSYIVEKTSGNISLSASQNIQFTTQSNGSVSIPINSYLSFDGTSIGSQRVSSNTTGDLVVSTNKNLYLTTTGGNIIIPANNSKLATSSNLQLGNSSEIISGSTTGINILSNSNSGSVNLLATSTVNICSSIGSVVIKSLNSDIDLFTTSGNVRLLPTTRIVFDINGTGNSIRSDTSGNFVVNGNSINTIDLKNATAINLSASSNVNISTGTYLNLSSDKTRFIVSDTNGNLLINSTTATIITSLNTNIINSTGTLSAVNSITSISTNTLTITGTTGSIVNYNVQNVKYQDPILTLANYTINSNDSKDRGIEYNYLVTSGSMKTGWFGWKNSSQRFTYYSSVVNTNETISGTMGQVEFESAYLTNNLVFGNAGQIDMNCGTISNLNTILGCSGTVNILATSNVNVSSNNILLAAGSKVQLPYNIPLVFGTTSNSISADSNGNMTITALDGVGKVILNSNVQINGITENVFSTVTNIQDPIFSIGGVTGPTTNDFKDRGIEFKWNNGVIGTAGSKTGFFGYKNALGRFVFIQDGTNVDEIYAGSYGNVQFGNGYFTNLDLANGTISNVNTLTGGRINIIATSDSINLSSGNVMLPYNSKLDFGTTSNSISSDTSGNLSVISSNNTNIISQAGNVNFILNTSGNSSVRIPQNVPLYFGSDNSDYIVRNTSNNLTLMNSVGNINLSPNNSYGSVNIPTNTYLGFGGDSGSTKNSLISDGQQLLINGYTGVNINTSSFTISGNVNIIGTITAAVNTDFDINSYILPLGTSQILNIQSINNTTTGGNVKITVDKSHNYTIGDSVKLKNTTSIPNIDGTYLVTYIPSVTEFVIQTSVSITTASGIGGTVKSNLTTYQGKDVGVQVNYWSTTGNTNVTSGSAAYKTGFFGFKNNTERWTYYNNATINNNVVTGSLSDIEVNEVFTNKISGFVLDGAVSAGSNSVAGSNFKISGGTVDGAPIGNNTAQTGRFTQLSNTVSASFSNVTLASSLAYTFERYTLSSGGLQTRNPSSNYVISMFSVSGSNYTSSSGTMPSNSANISDGTFKLLICSSMATGSTHTIYFGANKLITPNPINSNSQATKITFKRQGQSAQLVFDAQGNNSQGSWILLSNGVYVS